MRKIRLLRLGLKGPSVEKNCQLVKREGLSNANQILIEQAMNCGVTQARVQEELIQNWNSRKCVSVCIHPIRKLASLTYCATALSFLGHVALKVKDDFEHLPMLRECSGTPLLLGANCAATKK